ncbi:MAG: hypothetical protein U1F44_01200 [Coriobacteriia bacterium]|nr:hypothetical protein [Coriobacteriia bacterium]
MLKRVALLSMIVAFALAMAFGSSGCASAGEENAVNEAARAMSAAGHEGWAAAETGEASPAEKVGQYMSESHKMIALMQLKSAGMSVDLDSYDEVWLVEMAKGGTAGETIMVTVVRDKQGNTKTLLPENIGQ